MSSAVFGNDKMVDVVLALDGWSGTPIAQQIARQIGVQHDLVRKVLTRLETAGLVKALPRAGGSRGPVPWEVQAGPEWSALVLLARTLAEVAEEERA